MPNPTTQLFPMHYFVIRCSTPEGAVGVGLFGSIELAQGFGIYVFAGHPNVSIQGLDPFQSQMVSLVPDAVRRGVEELSASGLNPNALLATLAKQYRGTIFSGDLVDKSLKLSLTGKPGDVSKIVSAVMRIAKSERVLGRGEEPKPKANRSTKPRQHYSPLRSCMPQFSLFPTATSRGFENHASVA